MPTAIDLFCGCVVFRSVFKMQVLQFCVLLISGIKP